jgi:3-methylcrotonyl-CoA carboxylase alpha subunit
MFTKILIANRGEIACRIAATARRMGLRTVAVHSDIDADAAHARACDEAMCIGSASPADSYLRIDRIVAAALARGAQAVHPGYGFLSEDASFAQACTDAGLSFIGPPASAIAAMGSKSNAKALMSAAGVPVVPGYHGEAQTIDVLRAEADRIGYPLLIKASAGGGGKGMRRVDRGADFEAALAACEREAQAAFGDARVLLERHVLRPRHIEVQVFADAHGRCVSLFERDCSVQRRHQKLLEEAPAPGLSAVQRAEIGAAAVAAAQAVGYVGAGTVEFIAEPVEGKPDRPDGAAPEGGLRFYFMEMNTRLQVEHPVTEAITGFDLVEWQLRVAAGEALPAAPSQLRFEGHAIEARICAENPGAGFLPATGRLQVLRWPEHVPFRVTRDAVRIDTGVREGDVVTPHYDPMLAKVIAWGSDRAEAISRLQSALAATRIVGVHSNVEFLRRAVTSKAFTSADLDTALIEREHAALFEAPGLALEWIAAGVLAQQLAAESAHEIADPWSRRDGWRLHGRASRHLTLEVDGTRHAVRLERTAHGDAQLVVDNVRRAYAASHGDDDWHGVALDGVRQRLAVHAVGDAVHVFAADARAVARIVDPLARNIEGAAHHRGGLTAPMPGKLIALLADTGDAVKRGQPLAVIEAMKMEHTVTAPHDGTIAAWLCGVGDQVDEGSELLQLAPAD